MRKGKFIVFEGGEGSGKTTALEEIYEWLKLKGIKCIKTREPGGIKISEDIRKVILDLNNKEMDGRTEALLYAAARRQHLVEKVLPALEDGYIVLCDRFIFSSLAYQGHARELGIDEVYSINKFAVEDCMPDLTIIFDLEPQIGLDRINQNKQREINRLDIETLDFHNKVREGYSIVSKSFNLKSKIIDAAVSKEEVLNNLKSIIIKELNID